MKALLLFAVSTLALAVYAGRVQFRGVNMGGLEFEGFWKDTQPFINSVDTWNNRKANIIRIPFRWDVLQNPNAAGAPDPNSWNTDYLNYIIALTNKAVGYGMTVILDCHQYARYPYSGPINGNLIKDGQTTTPAHFRSFWQKLAGTSPFTNNHQVWFQLMNEPSPNPDNTTPSGLALGSFTAQNAYDLMLAGMRGIRDAGANNKVIVSGTVWSGAHDWVDDELGNAKWYTDNGRFPANADIFAQGFPNLGDWAIDVHTYFDDGHAGSSKVCHTFNNAKYAPIDTFWSAVNNLNAITQWAKTYNFQLLLGEVGWGDSNDCTFDAKDLLSYLDSNALVMGSTPSASGPWLGWTYWIASTHTADGSTLSAYNVEPDYYLCSRADNNLDLSAAGSCKAADKKPFSNVLRTDPGCWFYDPNTPNQACAQYFGNLVSSSPPSNGAGASNANYKVGPSGSVSLALSSSPSLFMTTVPFGDSTIVSTTSGSSPMFWGNASFTAVAGLADAAGVSFQSKSNPSLYLRHSNFYLWLNNYATDGSPSLFAQDATFYRVTPGLSGVAGTHSFQSKNFPGYWMSQSQEGNNLWAKMVQNPTPILATWNIVTPSLDSTGASTPGYQAMSAGSISLALSSNTNLFACTTVAGPWWGATNATMTIVQSSASSSITASYQVVTGLSDNAGFSFQLKSKPDFYLVAYTSNDYVWLNSYSSAGDKTQFKNGATWYRITPGIGGQSGTHSFQNKNFPLTYFTQVSESNGQWIKAMQAPTAAQSAWNIITPSLDTSGNTIPGYQAGPSGALSLVLSSNTALFVTTTIAGPWQGGINATTVQSSSGTYITAGYNAVAGLSDKGGVSFQLRSNSDFYLLPIGGYVWLNSYSTSGDKTGFSNAATWYRTTPGVSGVAGTHSFQNRAYPGQYLAQVSESTGQWAKIVSNPTAAQATWNIVSAQPKRLAVRSKHVF